MSFNTIGSGMVGNLGLKNLVIIDIDPAVLGLSQLTGALEPAAAPPTSDISWSTELGVVPSIATFLAGGAASSVGDCAEPGDQVALH